LEKLISCSHCPQTFDRCGYKKIGGQIVTKHDREMSERSNGRRMMEFPPGIHFIIFWRF
jgi:hypothetical protein